MTRNMREKPGAQTPWLGINQLLAADERFEVKGPDWQGFLLAPKHSSRLAALLYFLKEQELTFCVQGRGTTTYPESHHFLIVSSRAFSQLVLHEQGVVQVGAGCSLFDLHQFLLERKLEVALEGDPLASLKRSVGGTLLSGRTAGLHYRQETILETILGLEFVTWEGSQIKWGGEHRSAVAGAALHKLIWGFHSFPGIIVKVFLKTYVIPQVRLRLAWSFHQREALEKHVQALQDFSPTWENVEGVLSGQPTDQGFVFAQISGLQEEMEAFAQLCPGYLTARQQGEKLHLKHFLSQQKLKAHLASKVQTLEKGEYLWRQELDKRAWWLTPCAVEAKPISPPLWKERFWQSLCQGQEV